MSSPLNKMGLPRPVTLGTLAVLAAMLVLLTLGAANGAMKATWTELEDGVFWV